MILAIVIGISGFLRRVFCLVNGHCTHHGWADLALVPTALDPLKIGSVSSGDGLKQRHPS